MRPIDCAHCGEAHPSIAEVKSCGRRRRLALFAFLDGLGVELLPWQRRMLEAIF
jgi:hypothetical protein